MYKAENNTLFFTYYYSQKVENVQQTLTASKNNTHSVK